MSERYRPICPDTAMNIALISTLLWLSACGASPTLIGPVLAASKPTETQYAPTDPTPIPDVTQLYDFCQIHDPKDIVSQVIAGTPHPDEIVSWGNKSELEKMILFPEHILGPQPEANKSLVVLVPVGFTGTQDMAEKLESYRQALTQILDGYQTSFAFLARSVDITMIRLQTPQNATPEEQVAARRYLRLQSPAGHDEARILYGKLKQMRPDLGTIIFIVNSSEYGGSGGTFPIVAVSDNLADSLIPIIHELGHTGYDLGDQYERYYGPGSLGSSGLFTVTLGIKNELIPSFRDKDVQFAWDYLSPKPPLEVRGKCKDELVYGIAQPSIMGNVDKNFKIGQPFNDLEAMTARVNVINRRINPNANSPILPKDQRFTHPYRPYPHSASRER